MNELERFAEVTTFIFDVDGVLTNSSLLVMEDGTLLRQVNVRDGYAIKRALQTGYRVAIITGGKSKGVVERFRALGVVDIYYGIQDKTEAYREFCDLYGIDEGAVMYVGDDMPDYEVMRLVGFAACPNDACPEILALSKYTCAARGGEGVARELIERVLRLRGDWLPHSETEDLPTSS